jgi:hypothetical protein
MCLTRNSTVECAGSTDHDPFDSNCSLALSTTDISLLLSVADESDRRSRRCHTRVAARSNEMPA